MDGINRQPWQDSLPTPPSSGRPHGRGGTVLLPPALCRRARTHTRAHPHQQKNVSGTHHATQKLVALLHRRRSRTDVKQTADELAEKLSDGAACMPHTCVRTEHRHCRLCFCRTRNFLGINRVARELSAHQSLNLNSRISFQGSTIVLKVAWLTAVVAFLRQVRQAGRCSAYERSATESDRLICEHTRKHAHTARKQH